jgi:DNA-directed RNA polymerase specialized sigma24 family protein
VVETDDAEGELPSSISDPPPAAEIETFFRLHWEGLVRGLLREGATVWEAQDAVADAIREALRRWPELSHPAAWVRVAARSHWLKQRHTEVLVPDVAAFREGQAIDPELSAYELAEWFEGLLAQLPPARREALELSAEGLTPTEIAALVGKTPEAIRTALRLGRRQAVSLWLPQAGSQQPGRQRQNGGEEN